MYIKLAARNVKRQIGSYLIYFMTVALTVALMFAVNNITYSEQLQEQAQMSASLRDSLTGITVFISLVVAFVLSYATSFMLKLRKREFGTYLTLGMTRGNILRIFLGETLILCGAALGTGILAGLFIYQCFMVLIMRLMEMEFTFASYSLRGLIFTVQLVAGVFLVSSLASALYLKRVSIYSLIHGEKRAEKSVRHPGLWMLLAAAALLAMVISVIGLRGELRELVLTYSAELGGFVKYIVTAVISLTLFHIALARGGVGLLQKSRRLGCRGTNTFVLRQLGSALSLNSVMLGALAALLALAVVGANLSFIQKMIEEEALRRDFPYDIMYAGNLADGSGASLFSAEEPKIPISEAEEKIKKYADIKAKHPYTLYTNGTSYFYGFTRYAGNPDLQDYYMKESDFNDFVTPLGYEPVRLEAQYFVVANDAQMAQVDWSKTQLSLRGREYHYVDAPQQEYRIFQYIMFFVVVPDEAVEQMTAEEDFAAYELEKGSYTLESLEKLEKELTFTETESYMGENFEYERCNYYFREFSRQERNRSVAIFIVSALYVSAVFLLMAMAILALKTLSGLSEDKKRYQILFRLGAGKKEQCRALRRQTFTFFFLPFAVPVLLGIPTALISAEIVKLCDFANQIHTVYTIAAAVGIVMTLIYVLYYTATYQIAKRAVIVR
ncbi:MAG: ABC transporter permease [Lachnospiraceae bacterium]|nr:ABC transporter permease [Lachnospiraceae bacterium]